MPHKDQPSTHSECYSQSRRRFPSWLRQSLPKGKEALETKRLINDAELNTVCEEAKCPNRSKCWSRRTATVLIMGKECTRNCAFCDIAFSKTPAPLDEQEPERIAQLVKELSLQHVVITMVTRDDLPDQGASHIRRVIDTVRQKNSHTTIEVLTSDFLGNPYAINIVLEAQPEIFNHNIETVEELSPRIRHKASYSRSLWVLQYAKTYNSNNLVKSGIMVGLGENEDQVKATIKDLSNVGCDIVTIGQYLQASNSKIRVKSFVTPEQFKTYEDYGYFLGIKHMHCGPFVRSSYNADLIMQEHMRTP